ncbi:hypothetical protein H072_6548 [Dactylellina haptotyla CBS 200.50]|uniref:Pectate lyase superfamily protein domain-containing protein n=1 Tax=Dactylellina haptotyla (strain CBS 200.50) TaxID=1284197 RepID=S8AEU2_DACHA|nr:hypothetical protein H072_6548 [Dactylellina haptotyla CBS 200.50]
MRSLILTLFPLLVSAVALPNPEAPDKTTQRRAVCTPASGTADDTPAIISAIATCGNGGTIVIPAGTTYYLKQKLNFAGCVNCDFQLEGTLKANANTDIWKNYDCMIGLTNINKAKIRSLTGNGVIDGNGQNSYDRFATDTSFYRPVMISINGGNGITLSGFRMKNPPVAFNAVKGATNIVYSNLHMDATSKSTNNPKNTDGFDVTTSTYVTIQTIDITNQDDCVAIKAGTSYVTVKDITCRGSHGLSIGSLGKTNNDAVSHIYFGNAHMIGSAKAAGIKNYPPTTGHGITTITPCYGVSDADCGTNPPGSYYNSVYFKNFSGKTSSHYAPVTGMVECGSGGNYDVHITGYTVTPSTGSGTFYCKNTPSNFGLSTCVAPP